MTWEERMAERAKERREAALEAEFAHIKVEQPWLFDPDHPRWADICRDCSRWELYNPEAPWLGHGWHQVCQHLLSKCAFGHDHHDNVVWFADIPRIWYAETPT